MSGSQNPPPENSDRTRDTHRQPTAARDEPSADEDTATSTRAPPHTETHSASDRGTKLWRAIRDSPHFTAQRWYVLETLLLIAPYPVFVSVYLSFSIDETVFLVVTLVYSIVAMYIGFFSRPTL